MRAAKDENKVALNDFEILLPRAYLLGKPVIPKKTSDFPAPHLCLQEIFPLHQHLAHRREGQTSTQKMGGLARR